MNIFKLLLVFILSLLIISCTKEEKKNSLIKEKSLDLQVIETYQEAMSSLN